MPKNVEIKARLADLDAAHAIARRLSGGGPQRIQQTDVFFPCANGRLKLRIFADDRGELIQYHRPDADAARTSDYVVTPTTDPSGLMNALSRALGAAGTVQKTRWLYLVGQTRVHLDEVDGLGTFLEFEVVLRDGQSEQQGREIASALMREFGVSDLIACAYVDLLRQKV